MKLECIQLIEYNTTSNPKDTWIMSKSRGFFLAEVLISLSLIAGVSILLLKHQWQLNQWMNHLDLYSQALGLLDNTVERGRGNLSMPKPPKQFQLALQGNQHYKISWHSPILATCCELQR